MDVAWGYAMPVEDVVGDDVDLYREASDGEIGQLGCFCSSEVSPKDQFCLRDEGSQHNSPSPPALQLTLAKSIHPHPYSPKSHINCSV